MNTRQVEYVLAIAEEKSISKAAERLYISQSSLSQALIKLEKELGLPLFIRGKKELTLTDAGDIYIRGAKKVLDIRDETYAAMKKLSSLETKTVSIGISFHKGMDRFLIASSIFQKRYLNTELYAIEEQPANLLKMMNAGQLDMSIITLDSLTNVDLPCRVIHREEMLLAIPKAFEGGVIGPDGCPDLHVLGQKNCVLPRRGTTVRSITESILKEKNILPSVTIEINNIEATLKMIANGSHWSIVPEGFAVPDSRILFCSLNPNVYRNQIIVYRDDITTDDIKMHFIDMLESVVL